MREVKTPEEVGESLTQIIEKVNRSEKQGMKNKEIVSNLLGLAGFAKNPYISVTSGIASMILGNISNGIILDRTELIVSMSKGAVEKEIKSDNNYYKNFLGLENALDNPNRPTSRYDAAKNARKILDLYHKTYKPFVR